MELLEPFGMLTVPDPVDPPDEVVKNVVPVEVVAGVTVADEPVLTTGLPPESSTWTTKADVPATGAAACELGAEVNTSWVAAPVASEKVGLEVAGIRPLDVALRL